VQLCFFEAKPCLGFTNLLLFIRLQLVINIISLLLLARLVEPIYGSKEFLKFLLVVDILTCSAVFVAVYITYAITASGTLLYTQFAGFHGLIAAMLVAVKQIMPQHEVKLLGVLKFRVKVRATGWQQGGSWNVSKALATEPAPSCPVLWSAVPAQPAASSSGWHLFWPEAPGLLGILCSWDVHSLAVLAILPAAARYTALGGCQ
jgi:membrane associated rhomboid family serine protease